MNVNITSVKTSSDGAWQGDNPLHFAFPLLILQTIIVLAVSRSLAFALKPLRQPKVIAEILGGILLGPSAMGRNKNFIEWVFPSWSTPILESVASIGLLFFLFLVGLELDLSSIRRSGKRAFTIAAAGVSLPFTLAAGVTFILRKFTTQTPNSSSYAQSLIFLGVSLSITAFPVLARILAELKLLTTHVGETAMAAAAFNDVVAWLMLALAIALTSNNNGPAGSAHHSPLTTLWILISSITFVAFMLTVVRPGMTWVAKKCSSEHEMVDEAYICLTLAGVMVSGFVTDLIGIHAIFGAFVFGLSIPKGGEFAGKLIKRIEDFVSSLLLPLYFASSGLKTNVADLRGLQSWGILALVISTACAGKILGTFLVAMLCMIPARDSLTLGLLMNTKGLVELIVLNIGREKKVLNDELFTILVLMALFTTFMTTPSVLAIYKPAHRSGSRSHRHSLSQQSSHSDGPSSTVQHDDPELRILCCVHGSGNVASMVNLIELTRGSKKSVLKLYSMHLVELTDRSSSIMMVQRARKNGFPFVNRFARGKQHDQVAVAFEAYAEAGRVNVRPTTAISALHTMHEDICHVAKRKRATIIILPFHKQWRSDDEEMEHLGHCWRVVNQRVFKDAPCSVALLVDRGFGGTKCYRNPEGLKRVCVLFFGGPNDREALELSRRMSESDAAAMVTVIRFIPTYEQESTNLVLQPSPNDHGIQSCGNLDFTKEKDLDEAAIVEFQQVKWSRRVEYIEKKANHIVEQVVAIGASGEYELIIVGNQTFSTASDSEYAELGPVGDALASSNSGIMSSVLVIQQHVSAFDDKTRASETGPEGNGGSSV